MILSFHPIIEAGQNIICAGRLPNADDQKAIEKAAAVIVPQGCSEALYRMARRYCPHVFPNLDVRFDYPGKKGQVALFRKLNIVHPETWIFDSVAAFHQRTRQMGFPLVIKFDWGGQGETVFKVVCDAELNKILDQALAFESSGQFGFSIQKYIACGQRSLRVVVIGNRIISYWRHQPDASCFGTSLVSGALIDYDDDPEAQAAARAVVAGFCGQTGLHLAGFDFIFSNEDWQRRLFLPLALEINYFFGRTGLGGSEAFYHILTLEVDQWLSQLGLKR